MCRLRRFWRQENLLRGTKCFTPRVDLELMLFRSWQGNPLATRSHFGNSAIEPMSPKF